ncbi:MAG: carboxypeptidase-like regulatory domain-containing protein [Planctomycetota bacterium]
MRALTFALALLCAAAIHAEDVTINAAVTGQITWRNGTAAEPSFDRHDLEVSAHVDERWGCTSDAGWTAFKALHPDLPTASCKATRAEVSGTGQFTVDVVVTLTGGKAPLSDADSRPFVVCEITAGYFRSIEGSVKVVLTDGVDLEADMQLRRYVIIDVELVSGDKPLPGVHCSIRRLGFDPDAGDQPILEMVSNEDGALYARLDSDQGNSFVLALTEPGLLWSNGRTELRFMQSPGERLPAVERRQQLVPVCSMHGRVTGAGGEPLRVVVDSVTTWGEQTIKKMGFSGDDGSFRLDDLLPGKHRLHVWRRGFKDYVSGPIVLESGDDLDVGTLSLDPTGYFLLTIRNTDGTLRTDLDLSISPHPEGFGPGFAVIDTETQTYMLKLKPGKYTVSVSPTDAPAAAIDLEFKALPASAELQLPHNPTLRFEVMYGAYRYDRYKAWLLPHGTDAHAMLLKDGLERTAAYLTDIGAYGGAIAWVSPFHRPAQSSFTANLGHYAVILEGRERPWLLLEDIEIVDSSELQGFQARDSGRVLELRVMRNGIPAANQEFQLLGATRGGTIAFATDAAGSARIENLSYFEYVLLRKSELGWLDSVQANSSLKWFLTERRIVTPDEYDFSAAISLDLPNTLSPTLRIKTQLKTLTARLELLPLDFADAKPWSLELQDIRSVEEAPLEIEPGPMPYGRYRAKLVLENDGPRYGYRPEFFFEFDLKAGADLKIDWPLELREIRLSLAGEMDLDRVVVGLDGPLGEDNKDMRFLNKRLTRETGIPLFSKLKPGRYVVWAAQHSFNASYDYSDAVYKTVDVSETDAEVELSFPEESGTLLLWFDHQDATNRGRVPTQIFDADGNEVAIYPSYIQEGPAAYRRIPSLAPGTYSIVFGGSWWVRERIENVVVRDGEVTMQVLRPVVGPTLAIDLSLPEGTALRTGITVEFLDSNGLVLGTAKSGHPRGEVIFAQKNGLLCGFPYPETHTIRLTTTGFATAEGSPTRIPDTDDFELSLELKVE